MVYITRSEWEQQNQKQEASKALSSSEQEIAEFLKDEKTQMILLKLQKSEADEIKTKFPGLTFKRHMEITPQDAFYKVEKAS